MDIYWIPVTSSNFYWKYNGRSIKKTSKWPKDAHQSKADCLSLIRSLYRTLQLWLFLADLTWLTENNKNLNVIHTTASSPQKPDLSRELIRWEKSCSPGSQLREHLTLAIMNRAGRDIWMSSLPPETLPIWHCVIIMSGKSHELGVCYHKEGSTGLLYISGAKKKRMSEKKWDAFSYAQESHVISGNSQHFLFNLICLAEL